MGPRMEPRTSTPARRLAAIAYLAGAGIPVGVNVAPVVPGLTDKVLSRLRSLHGGRLYHSTWRARQRGRGPFAEQIRDLFEVSRRRADLENATAELSSAAFRRPHDGGGQSTLF